MLQDLFEQNQTTNPIEDVMSESATEKKAKTLLTEAHDLMDRGVEGLSAVTDDLS